MPDPVFLVLQGFILILPAMAANPLAVITGGKWKMDFGKNFTDGNRILGDGKTWSGFFGGAVLAVVLGYIIIGFNFIAGSPLVNYGAGLTGPLAVLFVMSLGAMAGDSLGSFIKRRIGIKSGGNAGLLDQLPFVMVSLLFLAILEWNFFSQVYWNYFAIPVIVILTPPIHRAVNVIGFKLNRKSVPW